MSAMLSAWARSTTPSAVACGPTPAPPSASNGDRAGSRFRLAPHADRLATHRRETDVPVICPALYFGARLWRNRSSGCASPRGTTCSCRASSPASRRTCAAGPPAPLPARRRPLPAARRGAPDLERERGAAGRCSSLAGRPARGRASRAPAGRVPRARRSSGRPRPQRGDVRGREYADLLWRPSRPATPAATSVLERACAAQARDRLPRARRPRARRWDARRLSRGAPLAHGEIGPLRRGLDALVRRAKPERILPVGIAYDPLVRGRTEVVLVSPRPACASSRGLEERRCERLKRSTPLTCGQFVAHELLAGGEPHPAGLAAEREARAEGTPCRPRAPDSTRRRRKLAEAAPAPRAAPELSFLASEYESAR